MKVKSFGFFRRACQHLLSPLQGNFSISKEFFPNCILRNTFSKTVMHWEPTDLVKSNILYSSTSLDASNLKELLKAFQTAYVI